MKRVLIILSVFMVVGLVSGFTYTGRLAPTNQLASSSIKDRETWFKERMEWKREQIKIGLKEGLIGEEETKKWEEHFNYMEKFHRDNGYMSGCYGLETGPRYNGEIGYRYGEGLSPGYGRRGMRGNGWNRLNR